jgi:hypothetical protein
MISSGAKPPRALARAASLAIAAASTPLLSACGTATTGVHGRLAFEYRLGDRSFRTDRWIAAGSRVDLAAYAIAPKGRPRPSARPRAGSAVSSDRLEAAPVRAASSSRPEVAEVVSIERAIVRLHERTPGSAVLTVSTLGGDDQVVVRVAEVHRRAVEYEEGALVSSFAEGIAVVRGGTCRFRLRAYSAGGAELLGLGDPAPLAIEPAGAAALAPSAEDPARFDARFERAGDARLTPRGGSSLRIPVIDRGEVQSLALGWLSPARGVGLLDQPPAAALAGRGWPLAFVVRGARRDGSSPVLLGGAVTVRSLAPNTCAIGGDDIHLVQVFAAGACPIEARLGSVTARVDVPVEPPAEKRDPGGAPAPRR